MQTPPRKNPAISALLLCCATMVLFTASLARAGWPEPHHYQYTDAPEIYDSTIIPVVNTCLDPKLTIDQNGTAGGICAKYMGYDVCYPYDGMAFHIYYKIPYIVQCNNGVQYRGEYFSNGWEQGVIDPGTREKYGAHKGDVSFDGGCNRKRDDTYTLHSYFDYPPVRVDEMWRIRNMYFYYKSIGWREIGSINSNWVLFPGQSVIDSWVGKTVTLPPYSGGQEKLGRPVIFVHGLQVPYDETWGVRAPSCNLDLSTVVPNGSAPKTRVVWKQNGVNGPFELTLQAMVGFTGTCATSKNQVPWESTWKDVFHYSVAPASAAGAAWNAFEQGNAPTVDEIQASGSGLSGSVSAWLAKDDLAKGALLPDGLSFGKAAGSQIIDGSEYVKVALEFNVPLAKIDWEHTSRARDLQGRRGYVDQDTAGGGAYRSGTAADVLSRMQHLQKGNKINENGIYFFNGYRWNPDSGKVIQPLPWWNNAGPSFQGQRGESWDLYQFVKDVLFTHYGTSWRSDTSKKVDLVCHSQGGITVREMLANGTGTDEDGKPLSQGVANPLNHIGKVVTVNTPHFGSVSTTDLANLPSDYMSSIGRLVQDSGKTDITLADIDITPTMLGHMVGGYVAGSAGAYYTEPAVRDFFYEDYMKDPRHASASDKALFTAGVVLSPVWIPLAPFVGGLAGMLAGGTADVNVQMRGNWVKANNIKFSADWGILGTKTLTDMDLDQDLGYGRVFSGMKKGAHLALNSKPINDLAYNYPTLPNGQDLNLQTLHSNVDGLGDLVRDILSQNLDGICDHSPDLQTASCYGFARTFQYGALADAFVDRVDLKLPELGFLNDFQTGFLSKTDMAVDENSQKAVRQGNVWQPQWHPGKFQEPRGYEVRKFFTRGRFPDSLAPHGDLGLSFSKEFLGHRFEAKPSVIGAPMLGHDIYCALSSDCSDLLRLGGMAQLPEALRSYVQVTLTSGNRVMRTADAVPVVGDFSLTAMSQTGNVTGYRVLNKDGQMLQEIFAGPGEGLRIRTSVSGMKHDVVPPGYTVNPVIVRNGGNLIVKVTTWTGQKIDRSFAMGATPTDTLILQVLSTDTGEARPVLVGSFSSDTALRNPRTGTQVELWFREARGSQTTQSQPRMMLRNIGNTTIHGLEMAYTFKADPSHPPQLTAPEGTSWSLQARGGDLWNLVYRDSLAEIPPGTIWPSVKQAQVLLQMSNGAQWDVFKDPSNNRNFGQPSLNRKIVARDGQGRLLWGEDVGNGDVERPEIRKVSAWTREAAVGEKNASKPELEIRNEGNIPLQGLTARWYVRLPATSRAVLERWYQPEGAAHLDSLGNGFWAIVWELPRWIQPGEKTVGGSVGVHLSDWGAWDHSASPSAYGRDGEWHTNPWVVVTDAAGNVLWGNAPVLKAGIPSQDTVVKDTTTHDTTKTPNLLIEARNEAPWETNTVKPRVRITNLGSDTVHGFSLRFSFVEPKTLDVVAELWYPGSQCALTSDSSGAVQHATLTCRNLEIAPGQMWPDAAGVVFGVHHTVDWPAWDRSDDPSFAGLGADFAPTQAVDILP